MQFDNDNSFDNADDTREQRVYVEAYGDIWEYKDNTREQTKNYIF